MCTQACRQGWCTVPVAGAKEVPPILTAPKAHSWLWKLLWPSSFQAVTVKVSRGSRGPGTKGLLSQASLMKGWGWEHKDGRRGGRPTGSSLQSLLLEPQLQKRQLVLLVLFFDLAVIQTLQPSQPPQSCCPRQPCPAGIGIAPGSSPAAYAKGFSRVRKWGY